MATIYKHEPALFGIAAIISALVWMALIFGTMGIALIYVLFFLLIYLFVQSAFIARIKGTAVRITPEQFPDLHQRITKCCEMIELQPQPEAYLLHAHGMFNALATRFLGRHFIVLYSDIVDALDKHPDAVNFYIGHELGHLHRKHLVWGPWLWPAGMLPLLGAAYSRSREYTCDLYGLRCCPDAQTAMRGLAALSAGHNRWQSLDIDQYVAQVSHTGGFWMAFHELISDYPWLVKRMAQIKAPGDQSNVPSRNFFAWLLAMFIPRIGMAGGGASVLIVVAIIGILAAVALPAYQDYTTRAKIMGAVSYGRAATQAVENYVIEKNAIPQRLEDAGVAAPADPMVQSATIDGRNGIIQIVIGPGPAAGKSILFIPSRGADKSITWQCASNDIAAKLLPLQCRPPQQK